ncbi:MAG: J domain-containing protein [Thaumarchaeota archaeon]|nr:J domain-containing protein [Nitrososphaerota archaeon]
MSYSLTTKKSWYQTQQELGTCFDLWGITDWQTNYPRGARLEGFNQSEVDRTVTLTYVKEGKTINLQMGKQARAVDNLRVLYLAVDDMRLNEKRGIAEVLQSAYTQLQAPKSKRSPWEVLGVMPGAPVAVAEAAYRALSLTAHPDKGGSVEKMTELTDAINDIRKGLV